MHSIRFAVDGCVAFFNKQPNSWIHALSTLAVIFLGVGFDIVAIEWILLFLAVCLVWMTEMINSAIEEIVNWISPEWSDKARYIKDVSTAAVLIAALFALITAMIIFVPYILRLF